MILRRKDKLSPLLQYLNHSPGVTDLHEFTKSLKVLNLSQCNSNDVIIMEVDKSLCKIPY